MVNIKPNLEKLCDYKEKVNNIPNNYTARDRKLKDLNPNINMDSYKSSLATTSENLNEKKENDDAPDLKRSRNHTPKEKKVIDNTSNIFHQNEKVLKNIKIENKPKDRKNNDKKKFWIEKQS